MRGSLIGSGLVHLAVLVALFVVRSSAPVVIPGPDVVQVSLVGPSAMPTVTAPAPPPPEPEKTVPDIRPEEESGVKLNPKPLSPKKKKAPEPKRPEPAATMPALPSARVGSAGLSGAITLDQGDFEFTYYLVLVRNRIAQNWSPPAGMVTAGQPVRAVVYFKIRRGGEIVGARIEEGSNAEFFDRSAVRSVMISDPLPPLPLGYAGSELGVHFGFEYSGP